ncbi:hypothetical protein T4D_1142, partial [Trichinella pseudospiralis]
MGRLRNKNRDLSPQDTHNRKDVTKKLAPIQRYSSPRYNLLLSAKYGIVQVLSSKACHSPRKLAITSL